MTLAVRPMLTGQITVRLYVTVTRTDASCAETWSDKVIMRGGLLEQYGRVTGQVGGS
jgi:hypothetical protein